jgi:hypothetical protein
LLSGDGGHGPVGFDYFPLRFHERRVKLRLRHLLYRLMCGTGGLRRRPRPRPFDLLDEIA